MSGNVEAEPMECKSPSSATEELETLKEIVENLAPEEITEALSKKDLTETNKPLEDEFAYINQGFTSEIFKIEIKNLPKHYGATNLKNLLSQKLNLSASKIKFIKPGCRFAFACFRSEEDRENAIQKINDYYWKGKKLEAIKSKPSPDPLVRKRNREQQGGNPKKQKTLEESTTPLAYLSYEEQLARKHSETEILLKDFGKQYWNHASGKKKSWIEEQRKKFNGLPCELLPIKASPVVEGYRNKCEFSIGKNSQGEVVVGFRLGCYSDGFIEVGPVENLKHISPKMKRIAKLFEDYVKSSKLQVYNNETHEGHLRSLLVRESASTGELMLGISMNPQSMTEEELKTSLNDIIEYFSKGLGKQAEVTSLYFQKLKKRAPGEMFLPFEHIWGTTHIEDELLGLKFRISSVSFFQVNSKAAEVLYSTIADLGELCENTVALDICCGIGTIGLCLAKKCKKVLGVEIIKEAIEDAQFNAESNGIENCTFTCANSDDWIRSIMKSGTIQDGERVVAIVDPPRAGLHDRSIAQIRNSEGIQRLVYVSCSPKSVFKNFLDLCRPCTRTLNGNPFTPKQAIAVDLFPHTPHMELVVLFERDKDVECTATNPKNVDKN